MARGSYIFKERDVTRAVRGAVKAGEKVQRIEIDKVGTIILVLAGAATSADNDLDREITEFERHHGQG